MELNQKGQAAVTDALFLLLIVGVLAASLFAFSVGYGGKVSSYLSNQYRTDFATSALKTMLYNSVPRDPAQNLAVAEETDYLMAAVKEDFADDEVLLQETKMLLRSSSRIAMKPLSSSFDYMLVFQKTTDYAEPFFVYLYSSNIVFSDSAVCGGKGRVQRGADISAGAPGHSEYFCVAESSDVLQGFIEGVGSASSSTSVMRLAKARGKEQVIAKASLFMWTATCIPEPVFFELGGQQTLEEVQQALANPQSPWYGKMACKKIE